MSADVYLKEQKKALSIFLKKEFNKDITTLSNADKYITTSINTIASVKLWKNHIIKKHSPININYLDEIVSNLNQALLLGILGMKSPSYTMIRRSLENILSLIYYKDHPVEFYRKENELEEAKKQFPPIKDLKSYIIDFPFKLLYMSNFNQRKAKAFLGNNIITLWYTEYKELCNYTHASNSRYFDLRNYLDDIKSDNRLLKKVEKSLKNYSSIINTLLIIFYFDCYVLMKEDSEKRFIRKSIYAKGYKAKIREIFGEV